MTCCFTHAYPTHSDPPLCLNLPGKQYVTPTAASKFIQTMFASELQQQKQKDSALCFHVQPPVAQPYSSDGYSSSVSYSDAYLSIPVCQDFQDGLAGALCLSQCQSPSKLQNQSQELQVQLICNWSSICVQIFNHLVCVQFVAHRNTLRTLIAQNLRGLKRF